MTISNCLSCINDTFCTQCFDNLVFNSETIDCEEPIIEIPEENDTEIDNNTSGNNSDPYDNSSENSEDENK